jgi:hypothetical protein
MKIAILAIADLAALTGCETVTDKPASLSSSWRAQARHPRLAVPISEKAWVAGLRPHDLASRTDGFT